MIKTVVYEGEKVMGEVEMYLEKNKYIELMKGVKINKYSSGGERLQPLSVLHTISSSGICFKLIESKSLYYQQLQQDSPLFALHSSCLRDNKTAVVPFGDEEIHLVAMRSRRMDSRTACFWGFSVAPGLYKACLGMLNLRCLGIVFDLDETLIVANTLRSFEDRIEALQKKISAESDAPRLAGMIAEVKRYQDDKAILKQYAETDQVVDNGKVHKIQAEVVPALSDNHQTVVRPLIRLQYKNIVLTRINPLIRDTSVLVRLRPAWEDLRSYLTARGRKRFEVYVCTMAERDYALEMWRLLDPDSNLISTAEVLERIVCVKSGSKKSLFNVFHDGICHPKMALVIDDRLKVWDEKDQPRVHVVPAFAPYYAPQAEANNTIPVLCVARNVACNVRGGFFKEFDEVLLQRVSEVSFEDDLKDIHSAPDVSNFLVSEDDGSTDTNGNKEALAFDGMSDAEVERRLKEAALASTAAPSLPSIAPSAASVNFDARLASSLQFNVAAPPIALAQPAPQASMSPFHSNLFSQAGSLVRPLGSIGPQEMNLHSSPAREEGEVPESELDPDTRRRLLILQHGMQASIAAPGPGPVPVAGPGPASGPGPLPVAGPGAGTGPGPVPLPVTVPGPISGPGPVPRGQSRGGWFPPEDHMNPGPFNRPVHRDYPIGPDGVHMEKQRPTPFQRRVESSVRSDRMFSEKQRPPREPPRRDDRFRSNQSQPGHQSFQGDDISLSRSSSNKDFEVAPERGNSLPESPYGALHEIAVRCGTKAEFRLRLVPTTDLKFIIEAYFAGEKIGEGTGVKRREAQHRAAEAALMNLADRYMAHIKSDSGTPQSDVSMSQIPANTGISSDVNSLGDCAAMKEGPMPSAEITPNVDGSTNTTNSISALKELCMREGLSFDLRAPPQSSTNPLPRDEVYVEVEIDGQVIGKATGLTLDEAKTQAAEDALASLKSMLGQFTPKHSVSPRSLEGTPSKRLKPEYSEALQRIQSSRYPTSPVP